MLEDKEKTLVMEIAEVKKRVRFCFVLFCLAAELPERAILFAYVDQSGENQDEQVFSWMISSFMP